MVVNKLVADCCEFGWAQQPPGRNDGARHAGGNVRHNQNQVGGEILRVDVDEVLEHGERQVLGGVGQPSAGRGPAATKAVCSLSIERLRRVGAAEDPVDAGQLTPP